MPQMTLQAVPLDFVARFALTQLRGKLPTLQLRIRLSRVKLCSSALARDAHGKNCYWLQRTNGHVVREPV
jgi:hypothetical protein